MIKYNKAIVSLTWAIAAAAVLSGCGQGASNQAGAEQAGASAGQTAASAEQPAANAEQGLAGAAPAQLSVVCAGFAQYDFINQILGDNPAGVEVTYLLSTGVDMHSYQPSADDMVKIRSSDLFIYAGGESDQWVRPLVGQAADTKMRPLALIDMVDAKDELIVEGMEDDEHGHAHADGDHADEGDTHEGEAEAHEGEADAHEGEAEAHEGEADAHEGEAEAHEGEADAHEGEADAHEGEAEAHEGEAGAHEEGAAVDEHVWLSLKNAVLIVDYLADELGKVDPANADYYRENAALYGTKLVGLDSQYAGMVSQSARKTILVADRFPFRYLADDYSLEYFAAFPGCSAETEASFETVAFLSKKLTEKQLPIVLKIEGSDGKIAQTVIDNATGSKAAIETLDSVQSVTNGDISAGVTYLSIMEDNFTILKEALN